ncbi:MAG: hypothetical protein R2719_14940 [Micropruina sp.]
MEQADLLRVTRLLNRVEIRGGAGSGKTVLAIRQASDLASGGRRGTDSASRWSATATAWPTTCAALLTGPSSRRPRFGGAVEDLARRSGSPSPARRDDSEYWETRLPALMAERAAELPDADRFDASSSTRPRTSPTTGGRRSSALCATRPPAACTPQRRAAAGVRPVRTSAAGADPLVLDHNLRNTRQIASSFVSLAPSSMVLRGGDGPAVEFVAASVDDALALADDQVDQLLDEGWEPKDVALLTVGSRHPCRPNGRVPRRFEGTGRGSG